MKKTRKLSERELMIRKFRKFLVDNDALEAWYKNVKYGNWYTNGVNGAFAQVPKEWVSSFPWFSNYCITVEKSWANLSVEWYEECRDRT